MRAKLIFTFLVLVAFVSLSQAQTKEETIAWIKEKIQKYRFDDKQLEIVKIDECEIIIKRYPLNFNKRVWDLITIPTNPTSVTNALFFKSDVVKTVTESNKIEFRNSILFMDFSREDDLGVRFLKALRHLNTFCEKKNEAF